MLIESEDIIEQIRKELAAVKKTKVVIGVSGGLECTAALFLLKEAIGTDNILCVLAPYGLDDEFAYAQSAAKAMNCKYVTLNIRKSVDWLEQPLQNTVHKKMLGEQVEKNVVERIRFDAIAMIADYYDAAICLPITLTKKYINLLPIFDRRTAVIAPFSDCLRTTMIETAISLGCSKDLFRYQSSSIEKQIGLTFSLIDEYLLGIPDEEVARVAEYIEKLHNGGNDENLIKQ